MLDQFKSVTIRVCNECNVLWSLPARYIGNTASLLAVLMVMCCLLCTLLGR